MKNLIIIGARGWGREVYDIALACISVGANFVVKGFLDDKVDALNNFENYPPILASVEDYIIQPNDVFICALGDVNYKRIYVQKIIEKGGTFVSLVHPTAVLGNNAKIGVGCVIGAYSNLSCDTQVGDFVTFSIRSGMGHDSTIGNYTHVGGMTNISGFVQIGENVTIHPCCNIVPHRKIGDSSIIGTGSVVLGYV